VRECECVAWRRQLVLLDPRTDAPLILELVERDLV